MKYTEKNIEKVSSIIVDHMPLKVLKQIAFEQMLFRLQDDRDLFRDLVDNLTERKLLKRSPS